MSKTVIIYKDVAPGAAEDASFASTAAAPFANPSLLAAGQKSKPVITCEPNAWALDGAHDLLCGAVAYWSSQLSGVDCTFQAPPVITIQLGRQYSAVGLTLAFDTDSGAYCRAVNIKWYQQTLLKADADFAPNGPVCFCPQSVSAFDKIVLTLKETNLPYRYARLEQIVFGAVREFDMTEIRSAKIVSGLHPIAAEVPVSTLNWTLESRDSVDYMFQFKQPMEVRNGDNLIGIYYIDAHTRLSERLYSLQCQDAFGVLDGSPFPGGVYSQKSAKALLAEILGGEFAVHYAQNAADALLTGAILPGSKRGAIQQVLFAWGVCAATDGVVGVRVFRPTNTPTVIDADHTYAGAAIAVAAVVTQVSVSAHTYTRDAAGGVELGGVKYKDAETIYTVSNPNTTAADKKNVVAVTGATLVSASIGQEVAQRVYDFCAKRNTAKARIVLSGERLGDCVSIPNAWGGTSEGNLSKLEIVLSNTVAADCEVPS